jgi:predicted TIM-barrel fold metal-dependent hydrolase
MVAAMDEVGVDGALLVSPWTVYRDDTSYAVEVFRAHPDRFRLIAPVDLRREAVATAVESWAATPGAVGIRLMMVHGDRASAPDDPSVVAAVEAAGRTGLPVCVHCWGHLPVLGELARAHPSVQFVLDHLGLAQPMAPPAPVDSFDDLPLVLDLARHDNVAVKVTGACTMSRRPFPFDDLWEPVGRLIDAFGVDRCLWGTDWTRAVDVVSYADAVAAFRDRWPMSPADRDALMGGTAARLFRWGT